MLVLTRGRDESIMIGDDIEVTILDVGCQKVRLGIKAPRNVPVHRTEIHLQIEKEKKDGAKSNMPGQAH